MKLFVKFLKNSLYGEQILEDIAEKYACKSECWMLTEHDEKVKNYWKKSNGKRNVRLSQNEGNEGKNDKINKMPLNLGAFVLSNSKRIMNNCIHAINGFESNDVSYTDTHSLYIKNKHWKKEELGLVGKKLL